MAAGDTAWDLDSDGDDDDVFVGNPSQMGDREPSGPTALAAPDGRREGGPRAPTAVPASRGRTRTQTPQARRVLRASAHLASTALG